MGLLLKLKSLFNKNIAILPYQRANLVSFVRLKKNSIKINSLVEVEDNFNFVLVYYNKVCDILPAGTHKLNEDNIPKLLRYSKTPIGIKGMLVHYVVTDAYFVSMREFSSNPFKTKDRIIAFQDNIKTKVKLQGGFSLRVIDTNKFMKVLCADYAVIKNRKVIKEIQATVSYEIAKVLNKKHFSVNTYLFEKEKIVKAIEEEVNVRTKGFGVEVSKFFINSVVIPKKHLNEIQECQLESNQNENLIENNLAKLAEESINNKTEESVVLVNTESSSNKTKNNLNQSKQEVNKNASTTNREINLLSESKKQTKLKDENKTIKNVSSQKANANIDIGFSNFAPLKNDLRIFSNTVKADPEKFELQPEPDIIFCEPKEQSITNNIDNKIETNRIDNISIKNENEKVATENRIVNNTISNKQENEVKTDNRIINNLKNKTQKTCACCGAKNEIDAKVCCVCDSMLD